MDGFLSRINERPVSLCLISLCAQVGTNTATDLPLKIMK